MEIRKVHSMAGTEKPSWAKYLKMGAILLAIAGAVGGAIWNVDIKAELCSDVSLSDSVK